MENFTFYSSTYFAFGKGAESESGKLAKQFGATKILIHYGGDSDVLKALFLWV